MKSIEQPIQIVFDGPPSNITGRFVEVEQGGKGVSFGEWKERDDGYWVLELPVCERCLKMASLGVTAQDIAETRPPKPGDLA